MSPQEVKDNIGQLAFLATGSGGVVYIDNILLEADDQQNIAVRAIVGHESGFVRSEDLMLLSSDIQAWWEQTGLAVYKKKGHAGIENRFRSGDMVQLMSGGPIMTVNTYTSSSLLKAAYFNERHELQFVELHEGALRKCSETIGND